MSVEMLCFCEWQVKLRPVSFDILWKKRPSFFSEETSRFCNSVVIVDS